MKLGGEIGIRTLGTHMSTPDFESGPFDHSGISPKKYRGLSENRTRVSAMRMRRIATVR